MLKPFLQNLGLAPLQQADPLFAIYSETSRHRSSSKGEGAAGDGGPPTISYEEEVPLAVDRPGPWLAAPILSRCPEGAAATSSSPQSTAGRGSCHPDSSKSASTKPTFVRRRGGGGLRGLRSGVAHPQRMPRRAPLPLEVL